jgi:hypothetical protein
VEGVGEVDWHALGNKWKMRVGVQNRGIRRKGGNFANSAFVTDGALLGIKSVGSDAEHVVALDADTVDDGTYDGAGLGGFERAT